MNRWIVGILVLIPVTGLHADEGGLSFWLPGQFGALAAVPTAPGWSLAFVYYHAKASEGSGTAFPRGGRTTLGVDAEANLLFAGPAYTFIEPVFGAQAAVSLIAPVGRSEVSVDATLTGPRGRSFSGGTDDALSGTGDAYIQGSLKWSHDAHNFMLYSMGNLPVGAYDPDRLVNLGLGHAALDIGGGYTYFDRQNEFTAVAGITHNWENTDTRYQNGIDAHLDWSASHFVTEKTQIGLVGYFYHQITGDSGSGATQGDFKSKVSAIGPQLGHFFKVGKQNWYANLKGYYEFDSKNRAEGWNTWLALVVPLPE